MRPDRGMIDALAASAMRVRASSVSRSTIDKVKLHAFDSFGAMFAGARTAEGVASRAPFLRLAVPDKGSDMAAGPACAAATLCVSCRLTECDDIHLASCTTPGAVVYAALLAMCPLTNPTSDTAIKAVVVGYDIMAALGIIGNGAEIVYGEAWPTYLTATMTSAAVAGTLMQLSESRITTAIAIAATLTTGTIGRIVRDPSSRWLTLGCSVQNGLTAAAGAEAGLQGDEMVLERQAQTFAADRLQKGLSSVATPAIEQAALKPFCSGRQSLAATEAFMSLVSDEEIDPSSVERVRVVVPPQYRAMIDRSGRPKTKVESRGIRYQLAIAALHPDDLYDLDRQHLRTNEPEVCRIMDMVEVVGSDSYGVMYPRAWPGAVEIRVGTRTFEREVIHPRGDPERPLTWSDVHRKLGSISRHCSDAIPVDHIADAAQDLNFEHSTALLLERSELWRAGHAV